MHFRKIEVYHLMLNVKPNIMTELAPKGPRSAEIIDIMVWRDILFKPLHVSHLRLYLDSHKVNLYFNKTYFRHLNRYVDLFSIHWNLVKSKLISSKPKTLVLVITIKPINTGLAGLLGLMPRPTSPKSLHNYCSCRFAPFKIRNPR